MTTTVPLFAVPGGPELMIVLLLAVLLFGANKLPRLARSVGQAQGEFEKGRADIERELREIEANDADEPTPEDPERNRHSVEQPR